MLCVQRTGWGKSAVYFLATALLREQGAGPALIVSPLLALMRNQIAAAERLGIRAHTVNSTNRDAWEEVRALLAADAIDLLLISPERLNNPQFRDAMLPLFAERVGLLVVDEAHCISDWGHDFRPDYRRLAEMLERLPDGVAVLGTTATANDRVVADVEAQLRAGPRRRAAAHLPRAARALQPAPRGRRAARPGRAARVAGDLAAAARGLGHRLHAHQARRRAWSRTGSRATASPPRPTAARSRPRGASRWRSGCSRNELKAVVATSALGMGYDKPDLGFVVHYQAPGSVISYYQQVGRAGRGVEHADVVLLRGARGPPDPGLLHRAGVPAARAGRARARGARRRRRGRALAAGADRRRQPRPRRGSRRCSRCSTSRARSRAPAAAGSAGPARSGATTPTATREVTALRRREQAAMAAFGADGRCLMRALQEELDDPEPRDCGRCAVCAGAALRRRARPRARARGGAAPALQAARARGQEDGAGRGRRDAQAARRRARRGGPRAGAARRRRLGSAGAGRAGAPGASTTSSSPPPPRRCAAGARRWRGSPRCPRCRSGRARAGLRASGSPPRSACRSRRCSSAPATGRRSARWRTRSSRSRTCAASSRSRASCRRARACSSTTCASAAGRSRCSRASCAAAARAAVYPLALSTAF